MIKLAQVLAFAATIVSFQVFAAQVNSPVSARAAGEDYFAFQNLLKAQSFDTNCRPNSSCLKVACSTLDRFECDDSSEVEEISRACRGVWGWRVYLGGQKILGPLRYR